jgi:hypothetical protein
VNRLVALLVCLAVSGCVPWNEIHGPTVGAGIVYREDRGVSPQLTAGYSGERYLSWAGYAGDVQVGVEPWRKTVGATALVHGSFLFWKLGLGPTVEWSPGGFTWGLAISASARVALGARSTCGPQTNPGGCLGMGDTVYPSYLPRLHYVASFLRNGDIPMSIGADLLVSSYWLRHREARPANDP